MKAIIIEDEHNVREGFIKMLNRFCPEVNIIGSAGSVETGLELVQECEFDVLFLDINLPDGSGFDLLYQLSDRNFNVIFVTAYNQYAIDAFKVSASDYLMKPVSPDELKKALLNIRTQTRFIPKEQTEIIKHRIEKKFNQSEKIILKDADRVQIVEINDIIFCEANGSYTLFFKTDGEKILTSIILKEYERILAPYGFQRCHKSYLVNLEHIISIEKSESVLLLSHNQSVPLSVRKRNELLNVINNRFIK